MEANREDCRHCEYKGYIKDAIGGGGPKEPDDPFTASTVAGSVSGLLDDRVAA